MRVKETILILDTDKTITWVLRTLLESESYPVVIADSIGGALENCSQFVVSGLITEYRIEKVCTLDMIRKLKALLPEAYVMMVTDEEMREDEYEEMMRMGVDDYFLKPVPIKTILLHLEKGLRYRNRLIEGVPPSASSREGIQGV